MIEVVGTKADLGNGQANMEPSYSGGGAIQKVGVSADLKPAPAALGEYSKGPLGGSIETVGTKASLQERSAYKGWTSYPTPMSDRTREQSK